MISVIVAVVCFVALVFHEYLAQNAKQWTLPRSPIVHDSVYYHFAYFDVLFSYIHIKNAFRNHVTLWNTNMLCISVYLHIIAIFMYVD